MNPFSRIECVLGDIRGERVDAIVNAANTTLRGGGGVDGAIHRAAGSGLLEECVRLYPDGCSTGDARITSGHGLAAKWVIHAVGPVYHGGDRGEPELLASCHRRAMELASERGLATISFPAISCGAYGYPWSEAAQIALSTVAKELTRRFGLERAGLERAGLERAGPERAGPERAALERVRFVLFAPAILAVFEETAAHLARD